MIKRLELYIQDVIRGKKKGIVSKLVKGILLPLSWTFRLMVKLRNRLYEKGWMRRYVPPVSLVVSVGNIVAGGTGKTPVTLLIANAFYEKYKIAILSRGYRSTAEKLDKPLMLCEGQGPVFPASYCGDEPYLFAQRLPKAIVIVGSHRKKSSFLAIQAGAQVILLDDGMQHLNLVRDFDVVVMDIADPFGQGYFLPRGFLREEIRSLVRAHLIVLNHVKNLEQFAAVKAQLKAYTTAPVVGVNGVVAALRDVKGQEVEKPSARKIGMFCAIANPDYFRKTLEELDFEVVSEYVLADHDQIKEKDLEKFAQLSIKNEAEWLICTEKDRVKLPDQLSISLPILWVQLELQIVAGQEEWQSFLQEAESKIR